MVQRVILLTDLGFGDQGKGTTVDALARRYDARLVVRFNGGPQAGHGVIAPDGRYHIFAQFGSATFLPDVATFLSRFMLVDPWRMQSENLVLEDLGVNDALDRMYVSEQSLLITPFHAAANALREVARGDGRHGSCGLGVGETQCDAIERPEFAIHIGDLIDCDKYPRFDQLRMRLLAVQHQKREQLNAQGVLRACWASDQPEVVRAIDVLLNDQYVDTYIDTLRLWYKRVHIVPDTFLTEALAKEGTTIFEPAQGVLLDEWRGFHPYTTWSTCTLDNANQLLEEAGYVGEVQRLGIIRAYATRHGPGPFPSESAELTARLPDPPSARNQWQGQFRVGLFDAVLARYAIACVGQLDGLVVTCLDRLASVDVWQMVNAYQLNDPGRDQVFFDEFLTHDVCTRMLLGPFKDLTYQETLGQALGRVTCLTQTTTRASEFEARVANHVAAIESALGLPAVLLSFGPTANEKRF